MGHGRRIVELLLILILASPVLPWYGPSLKAADSAVYHTVQDSARPRERGALPYQGGEALGIVLADASVHLNNQPVTTGMAVFQGDVIQTGSTSGAIVSFRNGASASLAESTDIALEWESNTLNLRQGVLVVQGLTRQPARVDVGGTTVIVQGEGGEGLVGAFPALCRIAAWGGSTAVFNLRGHVEIHGAGAPFILPSGRYAHLQAGGPQAAGQVAGRVSKEIPEETVTRGKAAPVALKIRDDVDWEDLIQTLRNGRVQIALLDGSTLNVGARSTLQVTKHDVASQQTSIEMTVGKMRADVVKLTKPEASFQVETQTAVIGVVGTSFIVLATFRNTRVICLEGLVRVSSLNPLIAGVTTLHAGQFTNVPRGLPPGGALQAPSAQVNTQVSQTTVAGPTAGAPGGITGIGGTAGNAVNAGTAAVGVSTAGVSGAAIASADSASSTLSGATSTLSQVAATSTSAISSANSATTSSNSTTTTTSTITQTVLSPSAPCGCQ